MKQKLFVPVNSTTTIIQVRSVLPGNLLQLREIEKYSQSHPSLSLNDAAIEWINKNSVSWRKKHLTVGKVIL